MKSRKWIGTVLITLVVVAILSAGGYALYRYGYARGRLAASSTGEFMFHHFEEMPFFGGHMDDFPRGRFGGPGYDAMPEQFREQMEQFERFGGPLHFERGLTPRTGLLDHGLPSRTIFSPFAAILKLLFLGFIAWLFYKFVTLFTGGRSWQLSFNSQETEVEEEAKPKGRSKKS
jgi:hypothetical protein